ncbi:MAG: MFS transporter [Gammaproteobacteria bacterium]|nr:MFS transporter [Gammaproteobacteria bacterium]
MDDRAEIIHRNFTRRVTAADLPAALSGLSPAGVGMTAKDLVDLFESQMMSRLLDIAARRLRRRGLGYYTIGSSGHEGNAVFGRLFRHTDMAFLHYRSCAFLIERSRQLAGQSILYDILLSLVASSEDPVSGGRHKVLGSRSLLVPPQTSTVASHLPKAVGAAYSIDLARRISSVPAVMPADSIVFCNFGDASVNHSTALGAFNAAAWASFQGVAMPVAFVCEDNGFGISVPTPPGWVQSAFANRPGLRYFSCDGLDLLDTWRVARDVVDYTRSTRRPAFLHMRTLRLMGHAGSDMEIGYRSLERIEADEAADPLLHSARILLDNGILDAAAVCTKYAEIEAGISEIAGHAATRPKLVSAAEVMEPIVPSRRPIRAAAPVPAGDRAMLFAGQERLLTRPQPMGRMITSALMDLMHAHPELIVFGEDVGKKGGVYGITDGLQKKFGSARVMDTLLDEQSILGLAIGLAHNGFIPIPEIQFLAFVHNAEDQIRGEAATLPFFSRGQFCNPMVIRMPGLGYQKGFGGHFHNDNSIAVFRDIPGIIVACPSNGSDAVGMLRACVRLARDEGRVVVFLEPIALYGERDLHAPDDGLWTSVYAAPGAQAEPHLGETGCFGDGEDLAIVSYGNGYYLSRKAARVLEQEHAIRARVIDLRWLVPLPLEDLMRHIEGCERMLIVDECRRSGSVSEALMTLIAEKGIRAPLARVTAEDSFIPLGPAAGLLLPTVEQIAAAALRLKGASA